MNPVEGLYENDEEAKLRKSLERSLWGVRHGIPEGRLLFTRQEVATVLRTKPETVDKMVAKGRLHAIVLDEDEPPLFRAESILEFLNEVSPVKRRREEEEDY